MKMKSNYNLKKKYSFLIHEKSTVHVGKNGITDNLIESIKAQLRKKKAIKIRILKNAPNFEKLEELAQDIAQKTQAEIVEIRGHTLILAEKK